MELADMQDLGSCAVRRGGSSPFIRTKNAILPLGSVAFFMIGGT